MLDALKIANASTGGLSPQENMALTGLAHSLGKDSVIVEVGTFQGGTSRMLAQAAPDSQVYTIDLFDHLDPGYEQPDNLTIFRGTSLDFVQAHPDLTIDLLFIDANHALACVLNDIANFRGMLSETGYLAFHDYTASCMGVIVACNALIEGGGLRDITVTDTLLACRADKTLPLDLDLVIQGAGLIQATEGVLGAHPQPGHRSAEHQALMARLLDSCHGPDAPRFIGRGVRSKLVAALADLDPQGMINSDQVPDNSRECVICSSVVETITTYLCETKKLRPAQCIDSQDFFDYCCLEDLLHNNGDKLAALMAGDFGKELVRALAQKEPQTLRDLYTYRGMSWLFGLNYVMIFSQHLVG